MDSILDFIQSDHTVLEDYANEIKNENADVILYGSGCWAKQQYLMLKELGVEVKAVGVDAKYYKPGAFFFDKEIYSIENLSQKFPDASLWVGFNLDQKSFLSIKTELSKKSQFKKIYACDCAKYDNFANQNYNYDEVKKNAAGFEWIYNKLVDRKSKETLISYLNQRVSGDYKYAEEVFDPDHYFSKDIIKLDHEVFVDCGAFTGDTIQELLARDNPKKVYAFEPDEQNFTSLKNKYINDSRIVCFKKGAYSKQSVLSFAANNADASKITDSGDYKIEVDSIDNLIQDEKISFIKMDIEGAELEALKGATQTIKQNHPKLAISAYHKFEDLLTLPQFIYSLKDRYQFFLRRHSHLTHELVLYCI